VHKKNGKFHHLIFQGVRVAILLSKCSVLIAEDDDDIRENIVEYLGLVAANVYAAKDGLELLQAHDRLRPDIILCDVKMPNMDGLEAISAIRKSDSDTRIIVVSAYSDTQKLLRAIGLGLTGYIIKPIRHLELEQILAKAVSELDLLRVDEQHKQKLAPLGENYLWNSYGEVLYCRSVEVTLTKKERLFFSLLVSKLGYLCTFDEIIEYVWGEKEWGNKDVNADNIKALVKKIRDKLDENIIESRYGEGYLICGGG
jgi:DNA-binding response OmpR family regulator